MRTTILDLLGALRGKLPTPIYNFGSQATPTKRHRATATECLRQPVVGCDLVDGPGVDRIEDLHALTLADDSVGTALVLDTLEHVARPWEALRELARVVRPGGLVVLTSHFYFPIHRHPADYWRFTPEALGVLLDTLTPVYLAHAGLAVLPHTVLALATKGPVTAEHIHLKLITQEWIRWQATGWKERVLHALPPWLVGTAYRQLERLTLAYAVWSPLRAERVRVAHR